MSGDEDMQHVEENAADLNDWANAADLIDLANGLEEEESPQNGEEADERIAALFVAVREGCVEDVERILKEGVDVSSQDMYGETALHMAAREGHLDVVNALVAAGCPLTNEMEADSPLHGAAMMGHADVVAALLAAGAPLEVGDDIQETPLHYAVLHGQAACVELLVAAGANVNAVSASAITPLHTAVRYGYRESVQALLKAGANINARNNDSEVPLHFVCDPKIVVLLAREGANLNARDCDGDTPLHHVVKYQCWINVECLEQLLSVGANPAIRNNEGRKPIDRANDRRSKGLLLDAMKLKENKKRGV